jgi:hypothetical protein
MAPDDDDRPDGQRLAFTRSQLLQARGYSPEIVNGHTTTPEPAKPEPAEAVSPTCRRCGVGVSDRRTWCSEECRRKFRTEHEPAPERTRTTKPPEPVLVPSGSRQPDTDVLSALLAQPWVSVSVELVEMTVTVSRRVLAAG